MNRKLKTKNVSQQRIARELGVSQALVSLVLNGKRENISEESYQRIWNHALKIGYRPKGMMLQEESRVPMGVGVILRSGLQLHTASNFFSHVQHGLHSGLLERGYYSVFLGSEDALGVRSVRQVLKKYQLSGVAVLGEVSTPFMESIKAVQPNVVAISFTVPGLCHSVMPNEKQAVELLAGYLTECGHRNVGYVGGDKGLDYNRRRLAGFSAALESRGTSLQRKWIVEVETGDRLSGWEAAEVVLSRAALRTGPTAFLCGNGSIARGFINCLMQKGWRFPGDLSVVAVDATRLCTEENPQITGAHADPEQIGITAANLLLNSAERRDGILSDVMLPATLTVRQTSGKPRG